jgi:glutathione S-transferase
MLLIGQYDSPFVRRVAFALRHYGIAFEHRSHSVFRDADLIAEYNPLRKVPTLVLDDGTVLAESTVCLEILDGRVAEARGADSPDLLLPRSGSLRESGLRVCGFVVSALDKAVSLVYERELRKVEDPNWTARCRTQLRGTLAMLERERAPQTSPYWLGERPSHADIVVACAMTFVGDALPGLLADEEFPALRALRERCEALPAFEGIFLPFILPT